MKFAINEIFQKCRRTDNQKKNSLTVKMVFEFENLKRMLVSIEHLRLKYRIFTQIAVQQVFLLRALSLATK